MIILMALLIGVLYTTGVYMLLRRSLVKIIIGLIFMGNATNLLIFTVGRLTKGAPAFINEGAKVAFEPFADPVPQALILTAIVIGFGVQAFALVLFKKAYESAGHDDMNEFKSTDRIN